MAYQRLPEASTTVASKWLTEGYQPLCLQKPKLASMPPLGSVQPFYRHLARDLLPARS